MLQRLFPFLRDPQIDSRTRALAEIDLFKGLPLEDLQKIVPCMVEHVYKKGEMLFAEGDAGNALYLLESGKVEITKKSPDGSRTRLRIMPPPHFLGEMALLDAIPRTASAQAVEDTKVLLLHRNKLAEFMTGSPALGMRIMERFARVLSARFLERENQCLELKREVDRLKRGGGTA